TLVTHSCVVEQPCTPTVMLYALLLGPVVAAQALDQADALVTEEHSQQDDADGQEADDAVPGREPAARQAGTEGKRRHYIQCAIPRLDGANGSESGRTIRRPPDGAEAAVPTSSLRYDDSESERVPAKSGTLSRCL